VDHCLQRVDNTGTRDPETRTKDILDPENRKPENRDPEIMYPESKDNCAPQRQQQLWSVQKPDHGRQRDPPPAVVSNFVDKISVYQENGDDV
jgi:hypothetical protein